MAAIPAGIKLSNDPRRVEAFTSYCPVFTNWFFPDDVVTFTDTEPDKEDSVSHKDGAGKETRSGSSVEEVGSRIVHLQS
jgi:hypothetical protein